jgi:hypothetical protein
MPLRRARLSTARQNAAGGALFDGPMTTATGPRGTLPSMRIEARIGVPFALAALLHAQETPPPPTPAEIVGQSAVLAEAQGDPAAAEALLRRHADAAHRAGDLAAHTELMRALSDLLLRQGRTDEAAHLLAGRSPPPDAVAAQEPTDPVLAMVRLLDLGSTEHERVFSAWRQLDSLGTLAAPILLAEFDRLGPFGRNNTLQLLLKHRSTTTRDALLTRVRAGDRALAARLAGELSALGREHGLAIARALGESAGEDVLAVAFADLAKAWPDAAESEALARRLAQSGDPAIRHRVATALPFAPWVREVADLLRGDADASVRTPATLVYMAHLGEDEDHLALAALANLPSKEGFEVKRGWIRTAAEVLPELEGYPAQQILLTVDWRADPEFAVKTLCGLAGTPMFGQARQALDDLARSGHRLPPAIDDAFVQAMAAQPGDFALAWLAFVPFDAEDRVLARFDEVTSHDLGRLGEEVLRSRRPWHRFMARALVALPRAQLFADRDWSGAPDEAVVILERFARSADREARASLLQGLEQSAEPPAPAVLALLEHPDTASRALGLAIRSGANGVLAGLARLPSLAALGAYELSQLLPRFTPADLPLLLRVADETRFLDTVDGGDRILIRALEAVGGGDPRVVALARVPSVAEHRQWEAQVNAASAAAARVARGAFADALALLPHVQAEAGGRLVARLAELARPADVESVADALRHALAANTTTTDRAPLPPSDLARGLVRVLAAIGARARHALRAALVDAPDDVAGEVATAALAVAGNDAAILARELLASDRHVVVQAALDAPLVADDPALRELGLAAIGRLARPSTRHVSLAPKAFLERLPRAERLAVGPRLLDALDHDTAGNNVLIAALVATGEVKDQTAVPHLEKLLYHRSQPVRLEVARQLGRVLDRAAVNDLLLLLKDDDENVVHMAQDGLDRLARYEETMRRFR